MSTQSLIPITDTETLKRFKEELLREDPSLASGPDLEESPKGEDANQPNDQKSLPEHEVIEPHEASDRRVPDSPKGRFELFPDPKETKDAKHQSTSGTGPLFLIGGLISSFYGLSKIFSHTKQR